MSFRDCPLIVDLKELNCPGETAMQSSLQDVYFNSTKLLAWFKPLKETQLYSCCRCTCDVVDVRVML